MNLLKKSQNQIWVYLPIFPFLCTIFNHTTNGPFPTVVQMYWTRRNKKMQSMKNDFIQSRLRSRRLPAFILLLFCRVPILGSSVRWINAACCATKLAWIWRSSRAPMIWNAYKMGVDELSESLLVLYGGDYGGQLILGDDKWGFHPGLELLVPCILSEVVYDATNKFTPLSIHSHK